MNDSVVRFDNATIGYPNRTALRNLSLSVARGEALGIIGPNGSGKSTLLKAVLGLIYPLAGSVCVLGHTGPAIAAVRHRIGYLPQNEEIDPKFPATALEVVLMGRYSSIGLFRSPKARDRELALNCLKRVKLDQYAHEPFAHLSGGQKQRVLVARALAQEPEILLLDEPTTAIDVANQQVVLDIVRNIHEVMGLTVIIVTHDVNSITSWVDRVAYINQILYAVGPPSQVLREDVLTRVYGADVFVLRDDGKIRVVVGDHHA